MKKKQKSNSYDEAKKRLEAFKEVMLQVEPKEEMNLLRMEINLTMLEMAKHQYQDQPIVLAIIEPALKMCKEDLNRMNQSSTPVPLDYIPNEKIIRDQKANPN